MALSTVKDLAWTKERRFCGCDRKKRKQKNSDRSRVVAWLRDTRHLFDCCAPLLYGCGCCWSQGSEGFVKLMTVPLEGAKVFWEIQGFFGGGVFFLQHAEEGRFAPNRQMAGSSRGLSRLDGCWEKASRGKFRGVDALYVRVHVWSLCRVGARVSSLPYSIRASFHRLVRKRDEKTLVKKLHVLFSFWSMGRTRFTFF